MQCLLTNAFLFLNVNLAARVGRPSHIYLAGINGTPTCQMSWYNGIMNDKLSVDKAGRIVLPKRVRQQLQLGPGDELEMESTGEEIILRPSRGKAPLRKKNGIWVFRGGEPLSNTAVEETVRQVRHEREEDNLG